MIPDSSQKATRGRAWRQRGAAALEFALIAPIFVLLIGFLVDASWYYIQDFQVAHNAHQAAKYVANVPNSVVGHYSSGLFPSGKLSGTTVISANTSTMCKAVSGNPDRKEPVIVTMTFTPNSITHIFGDTLPTITRKAAATCNR